MLEAHPAELSARLIECREAYFGVQKALLVGRLAEEIKAPIPLARAGCSQLKQAFFSSGKEQLWCTPRRTASCVLILPPLQRKAKRAPKLALSTASAQRTQRRLAVARRLRHDGWMHPGGKSVLQRQTYTKSENSS
ncbi:hypothetical protein DFH07DRAFT_1056661 [Mycena maculata]|uniref:Uncharacterized protein n=1 Tax=Mycena maculata TaxID=230809 RepID=A0AAD7K6F9_9AGAR|nr:hypothetical protein DFH07DRAFT_1056661 [Mycena maculata]